MREKTGRLRRHILSPQVQKTEASKIIDPRGLCVVSFLGIHHFIQINKIILSLFWKTAQAIFHATHDMEQAGFQIPVL